MTVSVLRALRPTGFLNALTPFEIASRPVSDAPPLAKAFSSTKIAAPVKIALWLSWTPIIPDTCGSTGRSPSEGAEHADDHDQPGAGDEEVRREGECPAGLAHAAQVAEREQQHDRDGDRLG